MICLPEKQLNLTNFRLRQSLLTSPIRKMELHQDQVFKQLKARHWRAPNPLTLSAATPASHRKQAQSRRRVAEAQLQDFVDQKHRRFHPELNVKILSEAPF